MRGHRWISFFLFALSAGLGGAALLQRQAAAVLSAEVATLRSECAKIAGLRAENARLRGQVPTDAELQRLQSDRAALIRLRAELESLKVAAEKMPQ